MVTELKGRRVRVSNDHQSKEMGWSEFCFIWIGAKNKKTIERIKGALEADQPSEWTTADGFELKVVGITGWV